MRQDRVVGIEWKEDGQSNRAQGRAIVGADGVRSFLARQVEPELEHEQPVMRAMYFAYFHGVEPMNGPAAEFLFQGNSLEYCFPTDADLSLLAVSIPIGEFDDFRSDPDGNLKKALEARLTLTPRLKGAERVRPVLGSGCIPCYQRVPFGPGWALVGDAGMVLDLWSGQGIDQATSHAVILAQQLNEFLTERQDWQQAMAGYHHDRNEFSRRAYRQTSTFCGDFRPMTTKALERRGLL